MVASECLTQEPNSVVVERGDHLLSIRLVLRSDIDALEKELEVGGEVWNTFRCRAHGDFPDPTNARIAPVEPLRG